MASIGRRAHLTLLYNGVDATEAIELDASDFTFNEAADSESDSISLTLTDPDEKWLKEWFPQKGDVITASIWLENWTGNGDQRYINCGDFVVDSFSFSGRPITLQIGAVATPASSSFRETVRTRVYEDVTLQSIGNEIAKAAGIALFYEGPEIHIDKVEQSEQTDCSFYNDLVTKHGLNMKIFSHKIVVFSEAAYEGKDPIATLIEKGESANIEPSWQWHSEMCHTYTGAHYEYSIAKSGKTMKIDVGTPERVLKITDPASDLEEAKRITISKLNDANKNDTTLSVSMALANPSIVPTSVVYFLGPGKTEGLYFVTGVTWSLSPGNATSQQLNLRRIVPRIENITSMTFK